MFPTFSQFLKNENLYFESQKLQGGNTFNKTHCAAITNVKNEDDILKWKQCSMVKMNGLHEYFCEHHKALICQDPQKVHVIPNLLKDIKHFIYFPPFPPIGKTKEGNEEDNFDNDEDEEDLDLTKVKKESTFPLLSTYYDYTFNLVKSYDVYKSKNSLPEESESESEEEEEYGSAETFKRSRSRSKSSQREDDNVDNVDKDFERGVSESLGEFFELPDEEEVVEEEKEDDIEVEEEEEKAYEEEDKTEVRRKSTRTKINKQDKYTFIKENLAKDYNNALRLAEEYDVQIPKGRMGNEKKRAILQLVANVKYWKGELKAGINKSPEFGGKKFNDAIFNALE